ncbi:DUF3265 domain-containing protein [Vibrio alginolyticus]
MAFLVCGEFCGEGGMRKVGLCSIHPLTRRYVYRGKYGTKHGYQRLDYNRGGYYRSNIGSPSSEDN